MAKYQSNWLNYAWKFEWVNCPKTRQKYHTVLEWYVPWISVQSWVVSEIFLWELPYHKETICTEQWTLVASRLWNPVKKRARVWAQEVKMLDSGHHWHIITMKLFLDSICKALERIYLYTVEIIGILGSKHSGLTYTDSKNFNFKPEMFKT